MSDSQRKSQQVTNQQNQKHSDLHQQKSSVQATVVKTANDDTVNISVVNASQSTDAFGQNNQNVSRHHQTQNFSDSKDNQANYVSGNEAEQSRIKASKIKQRRNNQAEKSNTRQYRVNKSMNDPIGSSYSKTTFRFFNIYTGKSQQPLNPVRVKRSTRKQQSAQPYQDSDEVADKIADADHNGQSATFNVNGDKASQQQHHQKQIQQRSTSQGMNLETQSNLQGQGKALQGRESQTPDKSMYLETTSILSSLPGVSVNKVRQNRQKIELDVLKLHNRIQLLQQEEEKALRRIEETRQKAKQIIVTRQQNEERSKELTVIKQHDKLTKREKVEDRSREIAASIKEKQQLVAQRKILDAIAIKREGAKLKKKKEKMENQYIQEAQRKKNMIKMTSEINRERNDRISIRKLAKTKRVKEDQMFDESVKISKKEKEARKLEMLEAEILKRLRDTHIKQQQAIEEIQQIFAKGSTLSNSETPSQCTNYSSSKIAMLANTDRSKDKSPVTARQNESSKAAYVKATAETKE